MDTGSAAVPAPLRRAGPRAGWALWGALALGGCSHPPPTPPPPAYRHNLADYVAFRDAHPVVVDPNYLPFMVHRVEVDPAAPGWRRTLAHWVGWRGTAPRRERLVFCRWDDRDLPLRVYLEQPVLAPELDPERDGRRRFEPERYVEAVRRALRIWERDVGERISFQEVPRPADASVRIRLIGDVAPTPEEDVQVLGVAKVGDACRVVGGDPATGRLRVRFRVPELLLYLADEHGLLLPAQVERVALHEIGHALGMRGHSPLPSDLMYAVARDRIPRDGLWLSDVNSFLALYGMPNGVVYADPALPPPDPGFAAPLGSPQLELAPHVDSRLGFELQTPQGWTRIPTRYGVALVDGVAWDFQVSFQLNVHRYDAVEEYLARYAPAHFARSRLVAEREIEVAGRPARRYVLATPRGTREQLTLLASGDGRVFVALAETPTELYESYRSWFEAVLGSLEIRTDRGPAQPRDYAE